MSQENIPHTITPPGWTVETRQDGSILSCSLCQILTLSSECCSRNQDSSDQATFFQSSIVQFWWACVNPPFSVLSWQERHPVWSSAAVAHLLQGSTCCAFRDYILHTLVVTSGYLSYRCLSIISNQSAHSPLTSDINKAFSSTQVPLTGYFIFFWPFSVNPRDGCVWNSLMFNHIKRYRKTISRLFSEIHVHVKWKKQTFNKCQNPPTYLFRTVFIIKSIWSVHISLLIRMRRLFTGESYNLKYYGLKLKPSRWWFTLSFSLLFTSQCFIIVRFLLAIWTAPIHYRGSIGDQVMLNFSKSVPMKKQK